MNRLARLRKHVDRAFREAYGTPLSEYEISETRGYWLAKTPCGGRTGGCREPIHQCLGCEGGIRHSARYLDPRRDIYGRFASPFRTWQALLEAEGGESQ